MSSITRMPKMISAKLSRDLPSSASAFTMMVVEEIESIAPRKTLSIVFQPKPRPISYPSQIISTISSSAATNADAPTLVSLRKLNSSPSENISSTTPISPSVFTASASRTSVNGGV